MSFDPVTAALDLGAKLIEHFFPDAKAQAEAKLKLLEMQQNGALKALAAETDLAKGQLAVNTAEAASASLFVAGWRPAVGWACALAFAYTYVLAPLAVFAAELAGSAVKMPVLDLSALMPVLLGMLGLGGLRTYEKTRGLKAHEPGA